MQIIRTYNIHINIFRDFENQDLYEAHAEARRNAGRSKRKSGLMPRKVMAESYHRVALCLF